MYEFIKWKLMILGCGACCKVIGSKIIWFGRDVITRIKIGAISIRIWRRSNNFLVVGRTKKFILKRFTFLGGKSFIIIKISLRSDKFIYDTYPLIKVFFKSKAVPIGLDKFFNLIIVGWSSYIHRLKCLDFLNFFGWSKCLGLLIDVLQFLIGLFNCRRCSILFKFFTFFIIGSFFSFTG